MKTKRSRDTNLVYLSHRNHFHILGLLACFPTCLTNLPLKLQIRLRTKGWEGLFGVSLLCLIHSDRHWKAFSAPSTSRRSRCLACPEMRALCQQLVAGPLPQPPLEQGNNAWRFPRLHLLFLGSGELRGGWEIYISIGLSLGI